jgi:hypothetical protein
VGEHLWFGSMPGAVKARDLLRDPRFALHSASNISPDGDSVEVTDQERIAPMLRARGFDAEAFAGSHFFTADIREVTLTRVVGSSMVIELWRPGRPLERFERT